MSFQCKSNSMKGKAAVGLALATFALSGCGPTGVGSSSSIPVSEEPSSSSGEVFESLDPEKMPNYVEDLDSFEYDYETNPKAVTDPFFDGNIIYNETVMLRTQEDGTGLGYLRFEPTKIISVRDYTLKNVFAEGTDYVIDGNSIAAPAGSKIGHWTDKQMHGEEDIPAPYVKTNGIKNTLTDYMLMSSTVYTESPFYYGTQVYVTYAYDVSEVNAAELPKSQIASLPNLKAKLEAKSGSLKVVGIGDSVIEGCSSSEKFNHEPYQAPFFDLFTEAIERDYGLDVTGENMAVGGTTSSNGAQDALLARVVNQNPDLVLVHYGINDLPTTSPNKFKDNIEYIVLYLKSHLPNVEIILMSPISPNNRSYDIFRLEDYRSRMDYFVEKNDGVIFLDMTAYSNFMLEGGRDYYDMTGNGINHPNDYGHRLYTGALLATIKTA